MKKTAALVLFLIAVGAAVGCSSPGKSSGASADIAADTETNGEQLSDGTTAEADRNGELSEGTASGSRNGEEKNEAESESEVGGSVRIVIGASSTMNLPDSIICDNGTEMEIVCYGDGVLGSDTDLVEGCRSGTIDIFCGDVIGQTETIPETALLNIPYLYPDSEQWQEALEDTFMDWFQPYYNKKGLQLVSWDVWYMRCITSKIPVESEEDLAKLNMRIIENGYGEQYWQSLGVNTIQLSFEDFSYALKQGQVNSADAGLIGMYHAGILSRMKYVIETKHLPSISSWVMNLEVYESLTDSQRRALTTLSRYIGEDHQKVEEYIDEKGLQRIEPGEELQSHLKKQRTVVIEQLEKDLGESTVRRFLKAAGYQKS